MDLPGVGQLYLDLPKKGKSFNQFFLAQKEKDVEKAICDYLRIKGLFFWKQPNSGFFDTKRNCFRKHTSPYVRNGVADILCVLPDGRFCAFEVKSGTGRQSDAQKDFEAECVRNNASYFVVRSIEDVENALRRVLHGLH